MKRFLSIIIVACMLIGTLSVVSATETSWVDGFTFEFTGGAHTSGGDALLPTTSKEGGKVSASVPARTPDTSRLWLYAINNIKPSYSYDVEFSLNIKEVGYVNGDVQIQVQNYAKTNYLYIYLGGGRHSLTFNGNNYDVPIELGKVHTYRIKGDSAEASLYLDGVEIAKNIAPSGGSGSSTPRFRMILNNGSESEAMVQSVEITDFDLTPDDDSDDTPSGGGSGDGEGEDDGGEGGSTDVNAILSAINDASSANEWSQLKELITKTYASTLGITTEEIAEAGKYTQQTLYERLTGKTFADVSDVATQFRAAVAAQKEADSWLEKLTLSGDYVKLEDGKAIIDVPAKTSADSARKSSTVKVANATTTGQYYFDVEWEMALLNAQPDTNSSVLVALSIVNYRYYMDISANEILYQGKDYVTTQGNWTRISYDIGTESHRWRLVGRGRNGYLYIDDNYVSSLEVQGTGTSYNFDISAYNSVGAQKVIVSDFKSTFPVDSTDDIKVNLNVAEPVDNNLAISGEIEVPPFASDGSFDENVTAYLVAYNKARGYATKVITKDYTISKSKKTDLTHTFDITGVDLSEEELGIVFIGSSGKALSASWGSIPENTATSDSSTTISASAEYNKVNISGYAGKAQAVDISVIVENSSGAVNAATVLKTNAQGYINADVCIDPYTNASGEYTVKLQYGENSQVVSAVNLMCADNYSSVNITDADSFRQFVNEKGTDEEKNAVADDVVLADAYTKYLNLVGEGDANDYYALTTFASQAIRSASAGKNMLTDINTASASKDWALLKTLITEKYTSYLDISAEELADAKKLTQQALYEKLTEKTFESVDEVVTAFREAVLEQKEEDSWLEQATLTGDYVKCEDGKIIIDIPQKSQTNNTSASCHVRFPQAVVSGQYTFDVEWDMALESAKNDVKSSTLIELKVANYRYYLDLSANEIAYQGKDYVNTQGNWERIPCEIGTSNRHWRLVGRGSAGYLYIDGKYIAKLEVNASNVSYHFEISVYNNVSAQKVVLSGLKSTYPVDVTSAVQFNLNVGEPANNSVAISGDIEIPPFVNDESYDTNTTAYLVAYNKEYGYVTKVVEKDYIIGKGIKTDLAHSFDISDVDLSKEALGLAFIGTSGKPLADMWGHTVENKAIASTQTPGLAVKAKYNSVNVFGYTGEAIVQPVTILVKSGDEVKAVAQVNTKINGMIDADIGIDPETNNGGSYEVLVQYGSNAASSSTVTLICKNDLAGFSADSKEDFKNFINTFGTDEEKAAVADDQTTEKAYRLFLEAVGEGDKNDFFALTVLAPEAVMNVVHEVAIVEEMNTAAANNDWEEIKNIIMTKYAKFLKLTDSDIEDATKVKHEDLYKKLTNKTYTSPEDILSAFRAAVKEELPKHSWLNGFEMSISGDQASTSNILKEDGKLRLIVPEKASGAGSTKATLLKKLQLPGNLFDVEWTMSVQEQKAGSSLLIMLYTGAKRYQMGIYSTMANGEMKWYGPIEQDGTKVWQWNNFESLASEADAIPLNTTFKIRLVGDSDCCYVYLNDKFLQTILPASTDAKGAEIELSCDNSNSLSIESFASVQPVDVGTAVVTEMTVTGPENDKLAIDGHINVKPFAQTWDSSATAYAVAYNKSNGYVSYIEEKEYAINKGKNYLNHEFALGGLDTSENEMGVILVGNSGKAICDAWGKAPENVSNEAPVSGQETGMTVTTKYNEVNITGFVGYKAAIPVVAIIEDSQGNAKAAVQITSNANGMVDANMGINPYTNVSGEYVLKLQYGKNPQETHAIKLECGRNLFAGYVITDEASFKSFVNVFGTEEEKSAVADAAMLATIYRRYVSLLEDGEADDFFDYSHKVSEAIKTEVDEKNLIDKINTAAANGRWATIKELITKDYAGHIGVTDEIVEKANSISNQKELYMRLINKTYTDSENILDEFKEAVEAQKTADSTPVPPAGGTTGGITGGAGGGGGGGGASSGSKFESDVVVAGKTDKQDAIVDTTNGDPAAFKDIDNIEWAKESIEELRILGVISGDGNGYFYPNNSISREEFLKLIISALDIKAENGNALGFTDVNKDAWYYDYIETAYSCGIVNGISETQFGIGMQITRADMATMIMRALNYKGIELEYIKNAIVFDDVYDIPMYARDSVNNLYRAGLLNGTAEGVYTPSANTTRAQSAVAIFRIMNYLNK